jgi:hypothetical protein
MYDRRVRSMHRIFVRRVLVAACAVAVCTPLAPSAAGAGTRGAGTRGAASDPAAHASACAGRKLLTCAERTQTLTDDLSWTYAFVLDLELFETPLPLHLNNPALGQFWRFETSAAAARSIYEYQLQYEITDPNFEQIVAAPSPPAPAVHRSGIVDRRTAGALTALMGAEQSELVNTRALITSLNRASAATYLRGRSDWVAWQEAAAARFAARAAGAIGRVIRAQRAASQALMRKRLPFGIGAEDLKLAHRAVRRHGLAGSVAAVMQRLGLTKAMIALCVSKFEATSFGQRSFNLTETISDPATIASERGFQAALRHFAARVPVASRPPS